MNLEILKKYNIKAKKSLGQNFLLDENILDKISSFLDISGKNIVEVGPGYGALTEKLILKKTKSLFLIELDKEMIFVLNQRIGNGELNIENMDFKIINEDILKYFPSFEDYFVIANIPYYITSPILRHFLYSVKNIPEKMLILMQKDVGDKIIRTGKTSVLRLFIEKKCFVKEVLFVPKESFVPAPKVESSVLYFEKHKLFSEVNDLDFLNFIKKGFLNPRKKLSKNLESFGKDNLKNAFLKLKIDENIRGEDLDINLWILLFKELGI